jgi:hypothetical protein
MAAPVSLRHYRADDRIEVRSNPRPAMVMDRFKRPRDATPRPRGSGGLPQENPARANLCPAGTPSAAMEGQGCLPLGSSLQRQADRLSQGVWKQACKEAGLSGVTPHTLRHTRATWLMQEGVELWEAAGHLGMSVDMLTRVYGKHHPSFQERAAEV